jgi:hypothetical protein
MPRSDASAVDLSSGAYGSGTLATMRSLRRALLWASAAGILFSCSVNQAGLTDDGAVTTGTGGAAGAGHGGNGGSANGGGTAGTIFIGTAGHGGGPGTGGNATGVAGTTGAAGSGSAGMGGAGAGAGAGVGLTTGNAGTSGIAGSSGDAGGTTGGGGNGGDGNTAGTGGSAAGDGGAGDAGGNVGSGGVGGNIGSGGVAGTIGGRGGMAGGGRGGFAGVGAAGRGGTGGRGGSGGNPCAGYPTAAKAFVTPTDGRTHCYWPRSTSQTWSEAQQSCTLQNGHLATILSAEENAFVVSVAQFSSSFNDTWIGATDGKAGGDKNGPGTYKWVTNEPWSYNSWDLGQPDGFCDPCSMGQTCTCDHRAVLSSDGTWNDRWQDNMRSSVCEATPN